jgi:hypothetical protein
MLWYYLAFTHMKWFRLLLLFSLSGMTRFYINRRGFDQIMNGFHSICSLNFLSYKVCINILVDESNGVLQYAIQQI